MTEKLFLFLYYVLTNLIYINILVTHALFANDAKERLVQAGVRNMWSTDSVNHESNIIPLNRLLKDAVLNLAQLK